MPPRECLNGWLILRTFCLVCKRTLFDSRVRQNKALCTTCERQLFGAKQRTPRQNDDAPFELQTTAYRRYYRRQRRSGWGPDD